MKNTFVCCQRSEQATIQHKKCWERGLAEGIFEGETEKFQKKSEAWLWCGGRENWKLEEWWRVPSGLRWSLHHLEIGKSQSMETTHARQEPGVPLLDQWFSKCHCHISVPGAQGTVSKMPSLEPCYDLDLKCPLKCSCMGKMIGSWG